MDKSTCSIGACGKPVKRQDLCYGHYMKKWRYGTPEPVHPSRWRDFTGERLGTLVYVERLENGRWRCECDCGATRIASVGDLNRAGGSSTCGIPGRHLSDDVGYTTAHQRVYSQRGQARNYACVDCAEQAQHWSYSHDDPKEKLTLIDGYEVAYSTDPSHYSPRCVSCHKFYDLGRKQSASVVHEAA